MFRVMIVEDEIPVRNLIVESVEWEKLGFKIVYAAGDGKEALEFLEDEQVDLIITDIYMPFMDGIEFVKRLREKDQLCKVIFLTGYNDFEYAREAIHLEASQYLLKPITRDELENVLTKMHSSIEEEILERRKVLRLKQEFSKQQESLRDKLLLDIMIGDLPKDRIIGACKGLQCSIEGKGFRVGVLEVVNRELVGSREWNHDFSVLYFAITNIAKEIIEEHGKVITGEMGRVILLFTFSEEFNEGIVVSLLERMIRTMRHLYEMDLAIGLGERVDQVTELSKSYKEANIALEYKIIEGLNRVISYSDVERIPVQDVSQVKNYIAEIESAIRVNDENQMKKYLSLFFESIKFNRFTLNDFKSYTLTLLTRIYSSFQQCLQMEEYFAIECQVIEQILKANKMEEIQQILYLLCVEMGKRVDEQREDHKDSLVKRGMLIIEEEYSQSELDLNYISERLFVSSGYFARIFRKSTGQTFVDYLTNYRLDKAKELLRTTNLKVFEISERIGYEDAHYFSYNFRKNLGMTPGQFRKEVEGA